MNKIEYEQKLIQDVLTSIEAHGGKDILSSVILTGSFGRDEASYVLVENGEWKLISDVEIALVYPFSTSKRKVMRLIEAVSQKFDEDLNLMPIGERRVRCMHNFNLTFLSPRYKTVFTYDLRYGSKTVWGTDFLKKDEEFQLSLDPYEAKRLVANRIGELVYLQSTTEGERKAELRRQWKGKLLLALASAYLISFGEYVSSYRAQRDKILQNRAAVEALLGEGFVSEYERAFAFLREGGVPYEASDESARLYVGRMNTHFESLQLHRPRVNNASRTVKYCLKYLKSGLPYGILGFENAILSSLITSFESGDESIKKCADVWHRVLY